MITVAYSSRNSPSEPADPSEVTDTTGFRRSTCLYSIFRCFFLPSFYPPQQSLKVEGQGYPPGDLQQVLAPADSGASLNQKRWLQTWSAGQELCQ